GVPHYHIRAARLFEQRGADFAGPGAFFLPEAVLRGDLDVGPLEPPGHRIYGGEHPRDGDFHVAYRAQLVLELGHERDRLADGLVQLPIAADEWNASPYFSNTAMPGSFFPPRKSSEAPRPRG